MIKSENWKLGENSVLGLAPEIQLRARSRPLKGRPAEAGAPGWPSSDKKMTCLQTFFEKNSMFLVFLRQIVCFCPTLFKILPSPGKKSVDAHVYKVVVIILYLLSPLNLSNCLFAYFLHYSVLMHVYRSSSYTKL